jgi:type IV pilus assembly protein PilA
MLATLAQDIQNDNSAMTSVRALINAEASYSASYAAMGFTASIAALGPATSTPDANHAGYIDADLATGSKDGYQFTVSIPVGTSTGGTNFNYFLVAKPVAGHSGRSYCADSSGAIHYAAQGEECTITSPQLGD